MSNLLRKTDEQWEQALHVADGESRIHEFAMPPVCATCSAVSSHVLLWKVHDSGPSIGDDIKFRPHINLVTLWREGQQR